MSNVPRWISSEQYFLFIQNSGHSTLFPAFQKGEIKRFEGVFETKKLQIVYDEKAFESFLNLYGSNQPSMSEIPFRPSKINITKILSSQKVKN